MKQLKNDKCAGADPRGAGWIGVAIYLAAQVVMLIIVLDCAAGM